MTAAYLLVVERVKRWFYAHASFGLALPFGRGKTAPNASGGVS
jgi:hypothetical protein